MQIEVGKVFHRAGAANEKLLSAADWSAFLRKFGTEIRVLSLCTVLCRAKSSVCLVITGVVYSLV